ncbi:MAG: phosphoglycerate kinase [Chlamydiota bacterium]
MNIPCLQDLKITDKCILVRVDFNVPMDASGNITDDTRIKEALPTIHYILEQGGSIVLMSHLGRPKGKVDPAFSLQPVAQHLGKLLNKPILFAQDCVGSKTAKQAKELKRGEILLLENLRFYAAEENPDLDKAFAQKLAHLGELYVNDAFGAAHRVHSSTVVITQYFPGKKAAGLLMQKEINFLSKLIQEPKRPFYAIIGGSKISSKIGILKSLLSKVDSLFIGGGMAFTFFKAQGIEIGDSIFEEKSIATAKEFFQLCEEKNVTIFLPIDLIIADAFKENANTKIIPSKMGIPPGWQGMDIGPETRKHWEKELKNGAMIFWNGPLGVFEFPSFAGGTHEIAKVVADLKALTILGGGETVSAINALGLSNKFSHISTGGGASLEFLEFGELPGINALFK